MILANIIAREGILKGEFIDKEKNKGNNGTIRLDRCNVMHMSRKNYWPLKEARALVIDMCAVQLDRPNISATTISPLLLILPRDTRHASPLCRLCKSSSKTIDHILIVCPKLSQTEMKQNAKKVLRRVP